MNQSMSVPIRVLFLGIFICLSFTVFMAALTWKNVRGRYFIKPDAYAQTTGVITASRWYHERRKAGAISYYFDIQYQYRVNDELYRSDQVHFDGKGSKDVAYAQNYTRKYPVGRRVDVFYLPHDPAFSVLEPHTGRGQFSMFQLLVLAFAIATPIVCVIAALSSRKVR